MPLWRLRLRVALRAPVLRDLARSRRRLHYRGSGRPRLWRGDRTRRQARHGAKRAAAGAGHGGGGMETSAKRHPISPIAWAIAPAALLFILFFILPFGGMAMLRFFSGHPMSKPNVAFTLR